MKHIVLAFLLFFSAITNAQLLQVPDSRWTTDRWDATWLVPIEEGTHYGVYNFRKKFTLESRPEHFLINISADNRYRLFVNGQYVNDGPQAGDRRHWHFETLDIAPYLRTGTNLLGVQVTYFGEAAPVYMMGRRAGLIVQGNGKPESIVNTGQTDSPWVYKRNEGISVIPFHPGMPELSYQYYAAGPAERIDGNTVAGGLLSADQSDADWKMPISFQTGAPFGGRGYGDERWELVPRSIPLMDRTYEPLTRIRRKDGVDLKKPLLISEKPDYKIEANSSTTLLFDQTQLTTAFPELSVSGGKGAEIKLTYAEALFEKISEKGHRDSIAGKPIHGIYDLFLPPGGSFTFLTTTYRAFRYVQVEIKTGSEPLVIEKIGSWFTGYPFRKNGSVSSVSDPLLARIYDVGWRTARLCAYETYMDCPYWERLQYIGDTRIQALVSFYAAGDDRLARNAIEQFEWSLTYDGLTYSRYPSELQQFIPNYSLVWILMVNDFFMYRNDPEFVKARMPAMRRVLDHFKRYVTSDSMMMEQPYWDFIDHTFNTHKVVTESLQKKLTTNTLFYAYTLSRASEIFGYFNDDEWSHSCATLSQHLKASARRQCLDGASGLYADSPDKKHFSMHSNILAVLCGMMPPDQQAELLRKIVVNKSITPTTLYFDFYLARAMNQAGAGDLYYDLLKHWKEPLRLGLTTFPEGVNRSDCHAWSASPDFEMQSTFAGIQPQVPGFKKVVIRPLLQKLDQISAVVPHWAGPLEVDFKKMGEQLTGTVKLPDGITGRLEWGSQVQELKPGINTVSFKSRR